ncbi:IS4 family transposase [Blastopirellula sp. J2-11]|uniref:IS4 family transposase n=1 Tax=Blastopirellula sp. J2-11 TaxID=2943192 RepID=UPI0021C85D51|nr:IS4 family transposase [Blastopirellula sp. J2-11]UUO04994.1 IS4 family transposase [Blastopirellula sp. J2-11]UUO05078.1 IS4 family transposase [Blastopirellula sp. J2-11]UUO07549.1 IS4 family transposase [Blastopirellula sp. J2-11]
MSVTQQANQSLGQAMFGQAELGDKRRTNRAVAAFDSLCRHPGGTLPEKLAIGAELKGLYRLCENDAVEHSALIAAMHEYTLARIEEHQGPVLVVHDATELDYSTLYSLTDDLGQIGRGNHRGYICQNVLAVDSESGEVLGLLDQILHCRDEVPENETLPEHRNRETRESLLWPRGAQHLPDDWRLIDVADQGASTFEFFEHEYRSGRRFVIRNGKSRKVYPGHEASGQKRLLRGYAKSLPELGRFTMDVQSQRGKQARKARKQAEFILRGGPILLCAPHGKHGHHGNDRLSIYVTYVEEAAPPRKEKQVSWLLLTNEPVRTFDDAWRVAQWYERRWVIEEFHKAQKTGCGIEKLQFTNVHRLQPAIAMLSAVALTLLNFRTASRSPDAKTRPASEVIDPEYVEVLSRWRHGKYDANWSVYEFFYALARLGGHQNRRNDKPPGWLILWRGWEKMQCMIDGYRVAKCG